MLGINEKQYLSTVISSLNKQYNNAKNGNIIKPNNIYYLNIIYDLLYNSDLELTNDEIQKLSNIYTDILLNAKDICTDNIDPNYNLTHKNRTIQADKCDCNNANIIEKIFYWQEDFNTTEQNTLDKILTFTYLNTKPYDTAIVFANGKLIPYVDIGIIAFAISGTSSTSIYKIYDSLDLDVTNGFTSTYVNEIETRVFISINKYSYGNMNLKIKKII